MSQLVSIAPFYHETAGAGPLFRSCILRGHKGKALLGPFWSRNLWQAYGFDMFYKTCNCRRFWRVANKLADLYKTIVSQKKDFFVAGATFPDLERSFEECEVLVL